MNNLLLAAVALLFAVPTSAALSRASVKSIRVIERQLEQIRDVLKAMNADPANAARDVRGRSKFDDIRQWAYSPQLEQRLELLVAQARSASVDSLAAVPIDQAQGAVKAAASIALEISTYWSRGHIVHWRARWDRFARANGVALEPVDASLLEAENVVLGHLEKGDFARASSAGEEIDRRLSKVIRKFAEERILRPDGGQLAFSAPVTPCATGSPPESRNAGARLLAAAPPMEFYPPASRRLGEEGVIVLRVRVSPTGCPTGIAIAAHSGYPKLDEAAIQVAEHSTYQPAIEDGVPVAGETGFLIRFALH